MLILLPYASQAAKDDMPPAMATTTSPQELFERTCSACHGLDIPRAQRLDRKTWRWVMDDMVNEFGCTWITPEEQETIIDYLVEHYGRDQP